MADNYWSILGAVFGETSCKAAFECTPKIDQYGGYFAWFGITLYMIKAVTTLTDEYLVPSLEVIADKLELSNDVTGATFMAASSSAPELFTSLVATFFMVNSVGLGTITGSAVFNVLAINGATGLIACKDRPLKIWWYPLARDTFFCVLSIVELLCVLIDDTAYWWEGLIMLFTYILYCVYMKFNPRIVELLALMGHDNPNELEDTESDSLHQVVVVGAPEDGTPGVEGSEASPHHPAGGVSADEASLRAAGQGTGETMTPQMSRQVSPGGPPSRDSYRHHSRSSVGSPEGRRRPRWSMSELIFITKDEEEADRPVSNAAWPFAPSHRAILHPKPVEIAEPERTPSKASKSSQSSNSSKRFKRSKASSDSEDQKDNPRSPEDMKDPRLLGQELETLSLEPPDVAYFGVNCRDPLTMFWEKTMPTPRWYWLLLILSMIYIPPCTYLMVDAANRIGLIFRIPSLVMGLLFLAAGTSIPDALGSIAVARQGEGDMAVANALGSNVFNILFGLGFSWLITGDKVEFPGAFDDLMMDIIFLAVALVVFFVALAINRWYLTWRTGILLLCLYGLYVFINLVMAAAEAKGDPDK